MYTKDITSEIIIELGEFSKWGLNIYQHNASYRQSKANEEAGPPLS